MDDEVTCRGCPERASWIDVGGRPWCSSDCYEDRMRALRRELEELRRGV